MRVFYFILIVLSAFNLMYIIIKFYANHSVENVHLIQLQNSCPYIPQGQEQKDFNKLLITSYAAVVRRCNVHSVPCK